MMLRQRQIAVLLVLLFITGLNLPRVTSASPLRALTSSLKPLKQVNLGIAAGNVTTPRRLALNSESGRLYLLGEGVPILKEGNDLGVYNLKTGEIEAHVSLNTGDNEALALEF